MGSTRLSPLWLLALAIGLTVALGSATHAQNAGAASFSNCNVSVAPASKIVRRGGQVLLEGYACGSNYSGGVPDSVEVRVKKGKRWSTVATTQTGGEGEYSVCARVAVRKGKKVARLQATSASGESASTSVRIAPKGTATCRPPRIGSSPTPPKPTYTPPKPTYTPPPPEQGNPACPLSQPGSAIGLTLPSACRLVASDTASTPDPLSFWGKIDAAAASRHQQQNAGGDPHPTGLGAGQGNSAFRRMTVLDGDDVWGERAELGFNNSQSGPTAFYHEGMRRATFASLRLPANSPVGANEWRVVLQMKQAQPYANPDMASIFQLEARGGRWVFVSSWNDRWSAPAQQSTWTRFAFDVTYSQHPSVGSVKIYVDLNGDGDADDGGEQSPRMSMPTLKAETSGGSGPVPAGGSIPSHLRAGIYENPTYSCPVSTGCSVDVDNVQVVKP